MAPRKAVSAPTDDVLDFDDRSRTYSRSGPRSTASRKSSSDALSDTLETLYSEHRYLVSLLDVLEKESARLKPGKVPDYHLLLDVIDYLRHYPDQYHHPREDLLFARTLEHDAEFAPLLARLEREHRTIKMYNDELFSELSGIVAGRAAGRPSLARGMERYIAAYRRHMDYESRKIFPRAKGSLGAADLAMLGRKTRFIDDPLFGGEVQYRYRRLARNLQARLEAAGEDLLATEFSFVQSVIGRLSGLVETVGDIKQSVQRRGSESWQEQKETMKRHMNPDQGASLWLLPAALIKNHGRHWKEGVAEIRNILRDSNGDSSAASRIH